jgi:hypothetical protein
LGFFDGVGTGGARVQYYEGNRGTGGVFERNGGGGGGFTKHQQ